LERGSVPDATLASHTAVCEVLFPRIEARTWSSRRKYRQLRRQWSNAGSLARAELQGSNATRRAAHCVIRSVLSRRAARACARAAFARACCRVLTLRVCAGHRRRPEREPEAGAGPCTARARAAGAIQAFARGAQPGRAARGRGRVLPGRPGLFLGLLAARHTRAHFTHANKPAPAFRHCRVGRLKCALRSRSRIPGHGSAKLLLITSICQGPTSLGVASRRLYFHRPWFLM
jgi:hypothetical protein